MLMQNILISGSLILIWNHHSAITRGSLPFSAPRWVAGHRIEVEGLPVSSMNFEFESLYVLLYLRIWIYSYGTILGPDAGNYHRVGRLRHAWTVGSANSASLFTPHFVQQRLQLALSPRLF